MSKLLSFTLVVVNLSAVKIYILRLSRDQLRKMQLQGLRLGIVPNTTSGYPNQDAEVAGSICN